MISINIKNKIIKKFKEKENKQIEEEMEYELLKTILDTRKKLEVSNRNYELASEDLVEYYTYEIKTYTAKLDYLIKHAKLKNIEMQMIYKSYLFYDNYDIEAV